MREQFVAYRKLMNKSIKDVSDITGISTTTISRYENGHADIGSDKLETLCKAIGINIKLELPEDFYNKLINKPDEESIEQQLEDTTSDVRHDDIGTIDNGTEEGEETLF